jgi:hypothetical protein
MSDASSITVVAALAASTEAGERCKSLGRIENWLNCQIYIAIYLDGKSSEEAAQALGISPMRLKHRLNQIHKIFEGDLLATSVPFTEP